MSFSDALNKAKATANPEMVQEEYAPHAQMTMVLQWLNGGYWGGRGGERGRAMHPWIFQLWDGAACETPGAGTTDLFSAVGILWTSGKPSHNNPR